jgi:hypothetical protein
LAHTAAAGAASARAGVPANMEAITRQNAIAPLPTLKPIPLE